MKAMVIFILLLSAVAQAQIEFTFQKAQVKQGSIERAVIRIAPETMQKISLGKLKGATLGESIYLYDVDALSRRAGAEVFEAEAKVIFVKVPTGSEVTDKSFGFGLPVRWSPLTITPTQEGQSLIFSNFDIPERSRTLALTGILLCLLLLGVGVFLFSKKLDRKRALKQNKLRLKTELLSAKSFEDLVVLWKNKSKYLDEFPQITEPFAHFETVLFKYQFKPTQTEREQADALDAYSTFVRNVEGGFDGI